MKGRDENRFFYFFYYQVHGRHKKKGGVNMSDYILRNGELYHHGVKGMKWGVRRYQNKDGSLTPQGEKRYYNNDGTLTRAGHRAKASHELSYKVQYKHLQKVHDSKIKVKDDPNIDYSDFNVTKGKKYVKRLVKELRDGYVTSFKEDANGRVALGSGKTKRGVVIRDKDGNRVTIGDYDKAQKYVHKWFGARVFTGDFG